MEGFSLILRSCIQEAASFGFHAGCDELGITHLCFVDDLFVFTRGDIRSVEVLKRSLEIFWDKSGLSPSIEKSEVFFGNVPDDVRSSILNTLPFRCGVFPIRYLGVPLSSLRLVNADFNILVQKVRARLQNWKSKLLSYGGRRQLIMSVLQSLQLFWMAVFVIPSGIIHTIEGMFRDFLWAQGATARGRYRIAWEDVCAPVEYGGLGLKRLAVWNRALLTKHVWDVVSHRSTLWVRWIHVHYVRQSHFWGLRPKTEWLWVFRKILDIRPQIRNSFMQIVENGERTLAWADRWLPWGGLDDIITYRSLTRTGLHKRSSVAELVQNLQGGWPSEWVSQYPLLDQQLIPVLSNASDRAAWVDEQNQAVGFTVAAAYRSLDRLWVRRMWASVVWVRGHIPKHAMCLWMACWKRLPTQDRICSWKHDPPDMKCPLCETCMDSHNHLFFQCAFSMEVWEMIKADVRLCIRQNVWDDILGSLQGDSTWKAMQKLAFAALVYEIWKERNRRLYVRGKRTTKAVVKEIRDVVLLRMAWRNRNKKL